LSISFSEKKYLKKSLVIKTLLVFIIFVTITSFFQLSFGASGERDPSCHVLEISENCELSGIGHLVYGDLTICGVLALLFHYFAHKSQVRLDKIIFANEEQNRRRKDFAVFHLKSQTTAMLFNLGRIKKTVSFYNSAVKSPYQPLTVEEKERSWKMRTLNERIRFEQDKLVRLLDIIRSTLVGAQDVIEPEIVGQIDGVITFLGEMTIEEKPDLTMEFMKYRISKRKILYLLEKLKSYSVDSHEFKEIELAMENELKRYNFRNDDDKN
jgi:hypothetical protein